MAQVRFRSSLRVKLLLVLLVLSIAPILLVSYFTVQSSEKFFKQNILHSLEGIVDLKKQAIDTFIVDRIQVIETLASMPTVVWHLSTLTSEIKINETKVDEKVIKEEIKSKDPSAGVLETAEPKKELQPSALPLGREAGLQPAGNQINETAAILDKPLASENEQKAAVLIEETQAKVTEIVQKQSEESPQYQALKKMLQLTLAQGEKFEELFLLDREGVVRTSTHYEHEGVSESQSAYFQNALKATFIQDIHVSKLSDRHTMVIATPVKDNIGKVVGVFGARLNLKTLYSLVKTDKGLGITGDTVVGKKIDNEVVFMAPVRYDDEAALRKKIEIGSNLAVPIQEAAREREGYGLHLDYRGVRVLATWRFIPSLKWGLVVKVDAEEALQPVMMVRKEILIGSFLLGFIAIVISTLVSKGIVAPLRKLTEAADSISRGDLNVRLQIKSNDEVGGLADSFERMVTAIRILKEDK
jgi:HAMP domain-containing protein